MKLAVTGSSGQVATALRKFDGRDGIEIVTLARPDFDLAMPDNAVDILGKLAPDVVVNAAAWTDVDGAESHRDEAFRINAYGAEAIAAAAAQLGLPVVQISTDYVFSGEKAEPYVESDPTGPINAYGASKLEGEERVAAANPSAVILRTSWVYSETGKNFLKTMLRLASERDEISVVNDQFGAPTHADDIAQGIVAVSRNLLSNGSRNDLYGVFHMTAAGRTSWHGFAEAIFAALLKTGGKVPVVHPIPSSAYPTPAARPGNSVLCCDKIANLQGVSIRDWTASVSECILQPSTNLLRY